MANSDDPPFLNVGTEVSAKYRGAFCEATIKVAKKLVKCKVSYTRGHTETVANDVIKGPLKINANVEVRQSDGQYLPGTLLRLVDASTYTVVFDDGDERTLKRSSLCLKGARHYSASESLDQMPLTDPENFGTPVHYQTKRGNRRRRQPSQSSSPEAAEILSPPKKPNVSYPLEFSVGRCVFLENDRRRSCWLPAVVVPLHYVMEESEATDDTICIRSFKDGRFYAAKADELHSFSPDKEPLSSMLEGEIQPMYMCKPAIERAMAYLDTGDLPWDMELFDTKETPSHKENKKLSTEQHAERESFYERLRKFQEEKGITLPQQPSIAHHDLDLYKLHRLVKDNGGMERVTQEFKWRSLYLQLGMPPASNSSHIIKQTYKRYLNAFETYERAKEEGKNPVIKNPRKRNAVPDSDEDLDRTQPIKQEKIEVKTEESSSPPDPIPSIDSTAAVGASSSSQGECSSIGTERTIETDEEREQQRRGDGVAEAGKIEANDRIRVLYGRGKTLQTYEAKVLEVDASHGLYYVHYNGWNTRYDEWIERQRILEKVTTPSKGLTRPQYMKKKQGKLKPKSKENTFIRSMSPKIKLTSITSTRSNTDTTPTTTPSSVSLTTPLSVSTTTTTTTTASTVTGAAGAAAAASKGPLKGKRRRRTSSATETSSSSDVLSSPVSTPAQATPSVVGSLKKQSSSVAVPSSPPPLSSPSPLPVSSPHSPSSRVPPILSPEAPPVPFKAQPECSVTHSDTSSEADHSFDIKKEENVEWLDLESDTNEVLSENDSAPPAQVKTETLVQSPLPATAASGTLEHDNGVTDRIVKPNTSTLSTAAAAALVSSLIESTAAGDKVSTKNESNLQPGSDSSSSASSSNVQSDQEMTFEGKSSVAHSVPLLSPGKLSSQSKNGCSGGNNDSGVENSSESEGGGHESSKPDSREDLDFSIDTSSFADLCPADRIKLIQERMKAIQQKYMELKSEVTYLDRKKRRARRREREVAKLLASKEESNDSSLPPLPPTTASPISLPSLAQQTNTL